MTCSCHRIHVWYTYEGSLILCIVLKEKARVCYSVLSLVLCLKIFSDSCSLMGFSHGFKCGNSIISGMRGQSKVSGMWGGSRWYILPVVLTTELGSKGELL